MIVEVKYRLATEENAGFWDEENLEFTPTEYFKKFLNGLRLNHKEAITLDVSVQKFYGFYRIIECKKPSERTIFKI